MASTRRKTGSAKIFCNYDASKDHEKVNDNTKFVNLLSNFRHDPSNAHLFCGLDPQTIEEPVLFSKKLKKLNRKGKKQDRVIVVTMLAIYNFKAGKYSAFQRRICIHDLDRLISIEGTSEVLVHPWEHSTEYDYRIDCGDAIVREQFVGACCEAYKACTGNSLTSVTLSDEFAVSIAVSKKDAKQRQKARNPAVDAMLQRKRDAVARHLSRRGSSLLQNDEHMRNRLSKLGGSARGSTLLGTGSSAKLDLGTSRRRSLLDNLTADTGQNTVKETKEESANDEETYDPEIGLDAQFGTVFAEGNDSKLQELQKRLLSTLRDIHTKSPSNKALAEVIDWPRGSFLEASKILAECVIHPDIAEGLFWWLENGKSSAHTILDSASHMSVCPKEAVVRGWGTRALWRVISAYRQKNLLLTRIERAEGFNGYVLTSFSMPGGLPSVAELTSDVYYALLEILLNDIAKPSDNRGPVEPFGRPMACTTVLPLIFRLLPAADVNLRRDALKDMNVLLVKREENFDHILMQRDWISWLAPLLATCPKKSADRSQEQSDFLKYTMNLFAMILNYVFSKGDAKNLPIDRVIEKLFAQLTSQCGWTAPTVSVARSLLTNLIVKIGNGMKRWMGDADRPEWQALFKLCSVIEDFFFYRPVSDDDSAHLLAEANDEIPSIVSIPSELRTIGAVQPVVEDSEVSFDKRNVGLHHNMGTGEPEDLKLAQRVHALLQKLGFTGDNSTSTVLALNKARSAKDVINNGNILTKAYIDIVKFFEECSAQAAGSDADAQQQAKLIERLGKFLEKRQKAAGVGFFGKSASSKKQIVHSLKVSLMKQQAQQTIRSQVRSKMMKAKAPVIISEDAAEDEHASQATTARRLRGARAGDQTAADAIKSAMNEGGQEDTDDARPEVSSDTRCAKCEQPLLDDDGLEALNKHWHVSCFGCEVCEKAFNDAPFYERKGKAYCKSHYLERFGKSVCAGCLRAFRRGDSAMEAANKLWHQECFKCTNCTRLFEAEETFYEKDGLPYCCDCNELLFLTCPRCDKIVEDHQDGVAALGKNWHATCFNCANCHAGFESTYFSKTDPQTDVEAPYCERCFNDLFVPKCRHCGDPVKDSGLFACGASWHNECFKCTVCKEPFEDNQYFEVNGVPYCNADYWKSFGKHCAKCDEVIQGEEFNALNLTWHPHCFTCAHCDEPFEDLNFYVHDNKPYKKEHYLELFCKRCPSCKEYVLSDAVEAVGETWHADCLRDGETGEKLCDSAVRGPDGKVYSKETYMRLFGARCTWCEGVLTENLVTVAERKWHPECLVCADISCQKELVHAEDGFNMIDDKPYCMKHFVERKCDPCPRCGDPIRPEKMVKLMDLLLHRECLKCFVSDVPFDESSQIFTIEKMPVCKDVFFKTLDVCGYCCQPIDGPFLTVSDHKFHQNCLKCMASGEPFADKQMYLRDGWPVGPNYVQGDIPSEGQERMKKATEAEEKVIQDKEEISQKVISIKEAAQKKIEDRRREIDAKIAREKLCKPKFGGWKEESS